VFDLFEEWLTYHHVLHTKEAANHIMCTKQRTSYSVGGNIHVSMSFHDETFYIHDIAVRHVRQGYGTRFMDELRTYGKPIYILGPFTIAGQGFVEKCMAKITRDSLKKIIIRRTIMSKRIPAVPKHAHSVLFDMDL